MQWLVPEIKEQLQIKRKELEFTHHSKVFQDCKDRDIEIQTLELVLSQIA